ncbi:MAG TPA: hypothetical protein VHZ50_13445, partial [Puia sp.]|nr:hypothetical protein [Puia sp.]
MKTRMIVLLFLFSGYFNSNATSISGKNISFLEEGDSIIIFLDKIGSTSIDPDLNDIYSAIYKKNEFSVSINIGMRPQYLDVAYYRNGQKFGTKLIGLLLEKGDSILMHSGSDKLMFSGKGSITWIIQMQIFDIRDYYSHKMDYNESKIKFTESISDSLYDSTFRCLSKNKNSLSMPVYSLLKADIIGIVNLRYNYIINISVSVKNVRGLIDSILSYRTLLSKRMISLAVDELPFARFSKYYSAGILSEYTFDSCVVPNKSLDIDRYILFVDKYFLGRINEKLKTNALYKVRRMGEFRGITSRYLPI